MGGIELVGPFPDLLDGPAYYFSNRSLPDLAVNFVHDMAAPNSSPSGRT